MDETYKVEVEIKVDESDVVVNAADRVADRIMATAEWGHMIRKRVEDQVDELIFEDVKARVSAVIDRGFTKRDAQGLPVYHGGRETFGAEPVRISFDEWFAGLMEREARKRIGAVEVALLREIQRSTQVDVDALRIKIREQAAIQLDDMVSVTVRAVVKDTIPGIPLKDD